MVETTQFIPPQKRNLEQKTSHEILVKNKINKKHMPYYSP